MFGSLFFQLLASLHERPIRSFNFGTSAHCAHYKEFPGDYMEQVEAFLERE